MSTRAPDPIRSTQRFFAPEVIQTSAMDCGPAALKCLLEGFGIPVSYGRLREACHTDVDGTSIDTIEDVARQLGLAAEQVMMPVDHLFLSVLSNLPALVVVRLPAGHPHFLVVWRTHGSFVQVMDPATGRRWLSQARFLHEVYRHTLPIAAEDWRAWATSAGFLLPLRQRLDQLGITAEAIKRQIEGATDDDSWFGLAVLDAATRLVAAVVAAKGVQPGAAATTLLETLIEQASQQAETDKVTELVTPSLRFATASQVIPANFWSVEPLPMPTTMPLADETMATFLLLHGAVLVRVLGRQDAAPGEDEAHPDSDENATSPLAPDLVAALHEAPASPEWAIWQALRADGLLTPSLLLLAATLATVGVLVEAALLRGLLDLSTQAQLSQQPWATLGSYLLFVVLLAALEWPLNSNLVRLGRRLETRLRVTFLEKLPRLGDRYFHSRLLADMAQRAYGLRQLRELPGLALRVYRTGFQLLLTALGIVWLSPICAPLALLAVGWAMGCALLAQWVLAEQDSRVRTHAGALTRFYLDGLLGLIPVRTHSAERALRREHEGGLVNWLTASTTFYRSDIRLQALEALGSYGCTVAIVFHYLAHGGEATGVLLLLYWALNLSTLGQTFTTTLRQYPAQRNHILRVLEPLGAPEEDWQGDKKTGRQRDGVDNRKSDGVPIRLLDVTVLAGGHTILHDINLTIGAGEQVAIVGASGAGKSSLVGLLLGWHRPTQGEVWIDDAPLTGELLTTLRQQTAWVDPAVQVWNRSLWENLHYGAPSSPVTGSADPSLAQVMEAADLYNVLEHLPNGLQTPLGEGGGLVSGGEGQRVRLGRAMTRPHVRLAILDEPFRGLDRTKRRQLLLNARAHWRNATLLCITHDVGETQQFDRVLVVENGQIIEDGAPKVLATRVDSHYWRLLQAEEAVRQGMWQGAQWRHLRMAEGRLQESDA
jgi:ATP-binding cassette subfamily B protein